jgi:hypothetical protein
MKKITVCLSLVAMLVATPVFGQEREGQAVRDTPSSRVLTFNDELVAGSLVRPDETPVRGNRRGRGISLLRLREHFVQEMLKTVENL